MTPAHSLACDPGATDVHAPRQSASRPAFTIVSRTDPPHTGQNSPTMEYAVSFGPFRLLPMQRLLLEGGKPLHIGSRALDIVMALVEHPGRVVGKQELMDRVWPNTCVTESNLKVHVAALRRALGDGQPGRRFVVNVHGRGYVFVAPVTRTASQFSTVKAAAERARNLSFAGDWRESA
jgi:DNA-binding winged helix-turn-helix (wHTH) protein